jgi:PAS domain S-box-containing protein
MINEYHQEQAALYVLGAMEPALRASFEKELAEDQDIQKHVDALQAIVAEMSVALSASKQPSASLKARVMKRIGRGGAAVGQDAEEESCFGKIAKDKEGIVVTDKNGMVEWINDTLTEMCGYSLDEVRGRKLGPLLQGLHTDPQAVQKLRDAIQHRRFITQEILNYHKNGTPYWVSLTISPVMDSENQVRSFIAIEREIKGRAVPVE